MRRTTLVITCIALVFSAAVMGGCKAAQSASDSAVRSAYPTTKAADPAKRAVCLTNQQVFETQVAQWQASNPGTPMPATLDALKAAGAVNRVPACPNGGTYSWDGAAGTLTCSVDGHWK